MRARTVFKKVGWGLMESSELPLALRSAYLTMHRRTDADFAKHGVTADQFVLLATLSRGDALTQRELALRMPSDPSTVRAMLVLLENKGLIRRDPHPSDSRARTVSLTTQGKRKFQQLWKASDATRQAMTETLTVSESRQLVELLGRVIQSLQSSPTSIA